MTRWMMLMAAAMLSWGCGDEACTEGAYQCAEDALEICVDGAWEVEEDCAAEEMICHDMGNESHCMSDGDM